MSAGAGPSSVGMSEAEWEVLALDALGELGWEPVSCSSIALGDGERESWSEQILPGRLRDVVARLNPQLPPPAADEAVAEGMSVNSRDAFAENHGLYRLIARGIRSVVFTDVQGAEHNPTVKLFDFRDDGANHFHAANLAASRPG